MPASFRKPVIKLFVVIFVIVGFLFSQDEALAALQYVGGTSGTGTGSTYSVSLTSLTSGIGSAPLAGDLVIVVTGWASNANGNPGVTTPAGYTEEYDLYVNSTRDANASVNWKIMSGTPDTSVTVSGFNNTANGGATVVQVWRGADQTTPMDVAPPTGATNNKTAHPDSPSITPVTAGAYVLTVGLGTGNSAPLSFTAPAGYGNAVSVAGVGSTMSAIANIASKAWSSGAENPAVWTGGNADTNSDSWAAGTLAIRPDIVPPTPNPMSFASVPANNSATQISMTATTATDLSTPVNYLFTYSACGANNGAGGTTSSWQSIATYSDSGLDPNKCYGYTVQARDALSNTGTASSVSSTYTSANTPGTPTLGSPTTNTLNFTNAENSNPALSPTTNFAVQVVTTSPSDAVWLNKWVDASGNPGATAVWMTDTQLDALVLHSLQSSTLYGAKVKARNQDTDETALSAEGQGTTSAPAPITTISNFVTAEPSDSTIAPGASALVDSFGLQTSSGSDTVTGVTVTLTSGTGARVATVSITNNGDTVTYCSVAPSGDTATMTGCGIPITTTNTQFKIKITAIEHTAMPAPPGASYAVTSTINTFTSTNAQAGTDSGSATVTIDNLSPSAASSINGSAGNAQVSISWTNPIDTDYANQTVLRRTSSAITDTPTEGALYSEGNTIGSATVVCVIMTPTATCTDTGLNNGTAYHYKIFSKDSNGNYSAGVVPTGSPFTPSLSTFTIISTAGSGGTISPLGTTTVAQGSSQLYTITPILGYDVATLVVDGSSIATSTTYTFGNVQQNHTIDAAFVQITPTYTITSTTGTNGTISPLGATILLQGADQTYTITPTSGYVVDTLTVDSVSIATTTSYTFTNAQANHAIAVTFSLIPPPPGTFAITATAGANGGVSPTGVTIVTQGNSQTYTITPSSGYSIGTLTVDTVSIATSTSYTFTNVQTNHTIEATFIALSAGATTAVPPDSGASRPTTVSFLGKAFPKGTIQIIDKTLSDEKIFNQKNIIDDDGSFRISFVGIFQTLHSFGLIVKDSLGRSSQTKFFTIDTRSDDFVVKDILTPPTIDIVNGQVSRGSNALVTGYASPKHIVQIKLDGIIKDKIITEKDGSYLFKLSTGELAFGQHKVQAIQIDPASAKESDLSLSRTFVVSRLSVVQADLSGDGKIDIRDWSIFLSRWVSKDSLLRESIDLNGDGKINIIDFSIFIKTIRK
ncbi:MAG: hypothetical protein HY228_01180 [Candidatus Yonathbacteria bacterium]|nr:hypothetical protein [Candidatus Yonathbacteria bacterium]